MPALRDRSVSLPIARQGVPWLPNFCSINTIGSVMAVTQIVAFIVLLAPDSGLRLGLKNFLIVSGFAQWLAFCIVAALCSARDWLGRLPRSLCYALAFLMICAIAALASALVHYLDRGLNLNVMADQVGFWQFVFSITAVCALVSIAALRYFEMQQENLAAHRAELDAKVIAMQARIRPHFLFNTLNTIASLIQRHPQDAQTALEDLGELMRAALKNESGLSNFGAQRELSERYLAIEKFRMGERLKLEWRVDPIAAETPMPDFILQPLIENAVLHGLSPLAEGGVIEIDGVQEKNNWRLRIRNPMPKFGSGMHRGNGMALENIKARLQHHYGVNAGLMIESEGDFYCVTVIMPSL